MHAGSGPRYTDWSHLRVPDGEREAAAPYIPAARKLLGFVMDEARRTGLKSHKIKRTLRDGTVIIAEKIGDIPRMTILPKGGKKPIEIRTLEGFYFTRRIAALENHQPAILVEPTDEDSEWTALFYGDDEVGFDLAPEDQRGTYIDVFGTKAKQPWKRLDVAGGMWVDGITKEAVTWFRGYLGYWPMHYRHPITNYAPFVSVYGHLVYTTPFPEWRVLAAAMRDKWLYVMVCENLGHLDPPERPATASESGQVWASQPYTDDEYTYSLWRYPLSIETQPDTLIDTYKAGDHDLTGEQLWQGDLELAYGAWSFNADCTSIVTMQLPRRAIFSFHTFRDTSPPPGLEVWRISEDTFPDYPIQEAKRIELAISHGVGTPSVSLSQVDAPLTIAEEDGVVLTMELTGHETLAPPHEVVTTYSKIEYICGDFSIVAFEAYVPFGSFEPQLSRSIVYAHLPSKTFLFLKYAYGGGALETVNICYELYINGEEVEITDDPYAVDTTLAEFPAGVERTLAHARYTVPWFGAYNDLNTEWYFYNELDAMTLLLGIIVQGRAGGPAVEGDGPYSQGYIIVGNPYIPFTARIPTDSPYVTAGAIDRGGGAGGWSISQYGGPGPTLAWEDTNPFAPAGYFNGGLYEATETSTNPYYGSFGSAATYEGTTVFALKAPVWAYFADEDGPNPYPFRTTFYPFRWATSGDARAVIDAVDHGRLATDNFLYYAAYPVGHTGKPMKRQKTRFAA